MCHLQEAKNFSPIFFPPSRLNLNNSLYNIIMLHITLYLVPFIHFRQCTKPYPLTSLLTVGTNPLVVEVFPEVT